MVGLSAEHGLPIPDFLTARQDLKDENGGEQGGNEECGGEKLLPSDRVGVRFVQLPAHVDERSRGCARLVVGYRQRAESPNTAQRLERTVTV